MPNTAYECPVCEKRLVAEEEPPGIIHYCGDCSTRMDKIADGQQGDRDV